MTPLEILIPLTLTLTAASARVVRERDDAAERRPPEHARAFAAARSDGTGARPRARS